MLPDPTGAGESQRESEALASKTGVTGQALFNCRPARAMIVC